MRGPVVVMSARQPVKVGKGASVRFAFRESELPSASKAYSGAATEMIVFL